MGVLDELLDGRGQTLHHLTGGDTHSNLIWKHSNGHGVSVPPRGGRASSTPPLVIALSALGDRRLVGLGRLRCRGQARCGRHGIRIAPLLDEINDDVLPCWQPAKVAHFESREIRGRMEVL